MLWAHPAPECRDCPKRPSRPGQQRRAMQAVDAQYARSVVVQWLANAGLLADAEFLNDGFVAFGIRLSEVIEQAATPAHHHEKTAPGGMVLLMRLEMLRQFTNPCAQDRDLHFRRTGIVSLSPVSGQSRRLFSLGLTLNRLRSYSLIVCCYAIKDNMRRQERQKAPNAR